MLINGWMNMGNEISVLIMKIEPHIVTINESVTSYGLLQFVIGNSLFQISS